MLQFSVIPYPSLLFAIKVNAPDSGIGVFFISAPRIPAKLGSCTFHSRKLNAAEQNYDVVNCEPAIKGAVEEWRHWLEGSEHPLFVLIRET